MARLLVLAAAMLAATVRGQETVFVHRVSGEDTVRTVVTRSPGILRGEATGVGPGEGVRVTAAVETDAAGRLVQYERELRRGGVLIGRVSVRALDKGYRVRETRPGGSGMSTVPGGPAEAVVDAAFPEAILDVGADRARTAVRALVLGENEVRTVLIEARGEAARYWELPGGGLTVRYDAAGVSSLSLPGEEPREVLRADAASRPALARDVGTEERFVLEPTPGVKLGATLLRPARPAQPPLVAVLLGDAGPTDRDGLGGGRHAPTLRLLAEELARLGVATVRADKRGAGGSAGPEAGLAELAADAAAVLARAQAMTGAESRRTAVVGHGEGALVAAETAIRGGDRPAFVVALGGPGRSLADALEARLRARLASAGEPEDVVEAEVAALKEELARLKEIPQTDLAAVAGRRLLRDLATLDPATQITKVRAPVLVVHAAEDPEVPAAHVALLRASLAFSQGRVRFHVLDRADHDFLLVPEGRAAVRSAPSSADSARRLHPSTGALIADFLTSAP